MAETSMNPEMASGPEVIANVVRSVESSVSGVQFNENDSVYQTYIKQFEAVNATLWGQGKNPDLWEKAMANLQAGGKQVEFMAKDFVFWMMRGGPVGAVGRFVGEHLPGLPGMINRNANRAYETMLKPSEAEKRRVQGLTTLRTAGLSVENRINGTMNWIMGRR